MSNRVELRGILPAMVTPLTEDGTAIDLEALRALTERLISAGCGGLIPGGSTGEFTSLSTDERETLHSTVIETASGRVPVVPHTGAMTTAEAIRLSQSAEKAGATGVMVVPPYYDVPTFQEAKAYYEAVASSVGIPVMIYHIPGCTGLHLTPDQIAELAEIPGVDSIKDSGGDASALTELIEKYSDRLQVCNGWDSLTFYGLAAGAKAAVWGAANIFPELAVELYEAIATRGDLEAGRRVWSKLYPLVDFLESDQYAARVKAGCRLLGYKVGPNRLPQLPISDEDTTTLSHLLAEAGLSPISSLTPAI